MACLAVYLHVCSSCMSSGQLILLWYSIASAHAGTTRSPDHRQRNSQEKDEEGAEGPLIVLVRTATRDSIFRHVSCFSGSFGSCEQTLGTLVARPSPLRSCFWFCVEDRSVLVVGCGKGSHALDCLVVKKKR